MLRDEYDMYLWIKSIRRLLKSGIPLTRAEISKFIKWHYLFFGDRMYRQLSLFRATVLSEQEESKYETIPTYRFSYPDPKLGIKVRRGRANIEDYPAFYSSLDFAGSILEVLMTSSDSKIETIPDFFYVSEWCLKHQHTSFRVHKTDKPLGYDPRNNLTHEELNLLNMFVKHLGKCFTSQDGYDYTSQFAHNYLVGVLDDNGGYRKWLENMVEVIVYPSVISSTFHNYAFSPSVVDNKLKMLSIYKVRVPKNIKPQYLNNGAVAFRLVKIGSPNGESISWRNPTDFDHILFNTEFINEMKMVPEQDVID